MGEVLQHEKNYYNYNLRRVTHDKQRKNCNLQKIMWELQRVRSDA